MVPNVVFQILTIHIEPPKRGQPLYKVQDAWFQRVHPLYYCNNKIIHIIYS